MYANITQNGIILQILCCYHYEMNWNWSVSPAESMVWDTDHIVNTKVFFTYLRFRTSILAILMFKCNMRRSFKLSTFYHVFCFVNPKRFQSIRILYSVFKSNFQLPRQLKTLGRSKTHHVLDRRFRIIPRHQYFITLITMLSPRWKWHNAIMTSSWHGSSAK